MKMQIKQFASLMNVSVRTLRYYDEIGLLHPAGVDAANAYRYYDEQSVAQLRDILFLRELGLSLKQIPTFLASDQAKRARMLEAHREELVCRKQELEARIAHLDRMKAENWASLDSGEGSKTVNTALMCAFARAWHHKNAAQAVFRDELAEQLLTDEESAAIAAHLLGGMDFFAPEKRGCFANAQEALQTIVNTQLAPTPLARARFCEDSLRTAIRTGTRQYVILGAGMDTFAFRNADLVEKCAVFEVDHPAVQRDKILRIRRAGWSMPENLHFVPVDFSRENLKAALQEAGFDPRRKSFFSWLGVSYYLAPEEIGDVLDSISALSAEGSTLVLDTADEGLFSSPVRRVQNMIAMAAAAGESVKSCFSWAELEALLERHGFLIYEHLQPGDLQARYFSGRRDELRAFEHICCTLAVWKPGAQGRAAQG